MGGVLPRKRGGARDHIAIAIPSGGSTNVQHSGCSRISLLAILMRVKGV